MKLMDSKRIINRERIIKIVWLSLKYFEINYMKLI